MPDINKASLQEREDERGNKLLRRIAMIPGTWKNLDGLENQEGYVR